MNNQSYFYQFIEPISKELAGLARELENSIFSSPRTMLTHARIFVENILIQVSKAEKIPDEHWMTLKDRLDVLNKGGYLAVEVRDALHHIRLIGNKAAHDVRPFRYSEALLSWEAIYTVVKWFVEVYGPIEVTVPTYRDPVPQADHAFERSEIEERLKALEALLKQTLEPEETPIAKPQTDIIHAVQPGFTTVRTLTYRGETLEVPYFLRDAFLLPQRFAKSETFLIRLGAEQQGRIMSELPNDIEGLHKHVKRYNDKNDENFFNELKNYIEEGKVRRQLMIERPGELFFFYKDEYVVVTEALSKIPFTAENFIGSPNLLRQLNENQIQTVGQLPKELVVLAKYENVGIGTVEKVFEQLKSFEFGV